MAARDKMSSRALAKATGASESKISRLLSGDVTTYELISAVSNHLGIPAPFAVAQTEDEATTATPPKPNANDSAEEIIRKNLIAAREQAGYDQLSAADATGVPFETLRAYERGEREVTNAHLRDIAPVYGRKPGDFFEIEMPPINVDGARRVFFRGNPDDLRALSKEDLARAAALSEELSEKIRAAKKAQLEHIKKAKDRKRRT